MSQQRTFLSGTLREVAAACSGEVQERWAGVSFEGVSTDTRQLARGELFVALVGQKHNGHDFLAAAHEAGAAGAVVARAHGPAGADFPAVVVEDTLRALGCLAGLHRSRLRAKVAAVTGSTGKTTTKDMLGSIMGLRGRTVVAEGTHNNEVGVPLTLLRVAPDDQFCVLEFAMRGPGEIDYLAGIARPEVGVITNIGQSHVGRLGSREAIAQTKAELLGHLSAEGAAVLNADDFFFGVLTAMAPCRVVSFAIEAEADFRAEQIREGDLEGIAFELVTPAGRAEVSLAMPGRHNVMNALAAAAAGAQLGAALPQIVDGLESCAGGAMRMQRVRGRRGSTIINDAYNASPDSVAAALDVLAAAPGRRVFVFGDMLEMGEAGPAAHREVGALAARMGVARLVSVGELAALAAEEAGRRGVRSDSVADAAAAAELLGPELGPGDCVLVKGSRGMHLEGVVEALADDS
ncbi:MAG: UDP-N-acetylmuramoyl-tripeptide--D-alanyl-D-alanine ligase [Armatimonadota bacterium]